MKPSRRASPEDHRALLALVVKVSCDYARVTYSQERAEAVPGEVEFDVYGFLEGGRHEWSVPVVLPDLNIVSFVAVGLDDDGNLICTEYGGGE